MSYTRDRDSYTRGSGAIAASDYGNARRARERRAKLARFEREDRMLAQFTMGPRGGMGAIDSVNLGVTGRPTIQQGGNVESPTTGIQVGSGRTPTPSPPSGGGPNNFGYQPPPPQPTYGIQAQPGYAYTQPPPRSWVDPGPGGAYADGTAPASTTGGGGLPLPVAPSSGFNTKKWLLIAALIAGGTYLYVKNNKGGG